jgi:hypothetical protein
MHVVKLSTSSRKNNMKTWSKHGRKWVCHVLYIWSNVSRKETVTVMSKNTSFNKNYIQNGIQKLPNPKICRQMGRGALRSDEKNGTE